MDIPNMPTPRPGMPGPLRFVLEGWKDATPRSKALLCIPIPLWGGLAATVLAGSPWAAGALGVCALAASGFVLLLMYHQGRWMAAVRASASIQAFLSTICRAAAEVYDDLDRCEISALDDGRFVVDAQRTGPPYPHARGHTHLLPRWAADHVLHLARQQGLRDSTVFAAVGLTGLWSMDPQDAGPRQSAHARIAHRKALRDALAPHLCRAFDVEPLS